jgi:hypothetical protein
MTEPLSVAATRRYYCRRSTRFWKSIHGPIVCGRCHPPAMEELVQEWLESDAEPVARAP